ncbi:hypothetical protein, partial [uncultured Mailhella sp.]|uniref:hypothetical protein n=1 Tax=uncultured Mailhella sp. TaxID=1981031 RepID=UPI0025E86B80
MIKRRKQGDGHRTCAFPGMKKGRKPELPPFRPGRGAPRLLSDDLLFFPLDEAGLHVGHGIDDEFDKAAVL